MNKVFEIVKVTGIGFKEAPYEYHSTGLLFWDKIKAEKEANKLWKEQTTEEQRTGGWCELNYIIKERKIIT